MQTVKNIVITAILTGSIAGCTDAYTAIGNKWTEINSRVIVIDTCSVDISSIKLDSIITSQGNTVYAGIRKSQYWGTTRMSTYMTFKTTQDYSSNNTPEYEEEIIFESLTLYLLPDSTFCGDTMQRMSLLVHRLTEELELDDNDARYAHSSFGYDPAPIAAKTFSPHPFRGRAVEIRLSDDLGEEMLEKVINDDTEVEDDANFRSWLKGLMLGAEEPTGSILGFKGLDSLCMMKLYYRSRDYAEYEEHILNFKLDTAYMFTHVEADFTDTPLAAFSSTDELTSRECGNMAYASGMLGIYTRISFPYLNNLRSIGDQCLAANAELKIYPKKGTYCKPDYSSLPENLNLYLIDENNISTGGAITNTDGTSLQTGSLTYDDMMFPESTYYTYDITDFINDQFGKIGINRNYLQLIDPYYGYTLDELVIADRYSDGYNIKLTIELAIYDE